MRLVLMIVIGIAIIAFLIVTIFMKRKHRVAPNYKAFFIIGVTWLPLGIIMQNYIFSVVGACFLAVGLTNKKKWNTEPRWADLPPQVRRLKLFIIIFLGVLLLVGITLYILTNKGIINI